MILAGGGHAHLQILANWVKHGPPPCETVLISAAPTTFYSGMVPGWIAGNYRASDPQIDLAGIAARAGASLVVGELIGASMERQTIALAGGRELAFDWLSIGTGGTDRSAILGDIKGTLIPLRPIESFADRWVRSEPRLERGTIAIVGGGAAGVEMALAVRAAHPQAELRLIAGAAGLVPTWSHSARSLVRLALASRGIAVHLCDGTIEGDVLILSGGASLRPDCIISAIGSGPPRWLEGSGLALDPNGFIRVNAHQQSLSHPNVFAAGDAARRADRNVPPAGVHAVKAGLALARNLRAIIAGRSVPATYIPGRRTLYLISTGDRRAILSWGELSLEGRWAWWLKDWIDRRWTGKFRRISAST